MALCRLEGSAMSNLVHRRRRCARILTHTILCLEGSTPEDMSVYSCLSPWGYLGFCPLSRIFLGDYSDPYGAAFSLIQNRTDDFSSSFAPLRRKALQPSPQTFATAPANVCNRSRKRLREKPSFSICPRKYVQPSPQVRASVLASTCV